MTDSCLIVSGTVGPLLWRHYGRDGVSNHQSYYCLLNRLSRRRSKKTSKLRVTGLCVGKSRVASEFSTQRARNVENVFIWWRHHAVFCFPSSVSDGQPTTCTPSHVLYMYFVILRIVLLSAMRVAYARLNMVLKTPSFVCSGLSRHLFF